MKAAALIGTLSVSLYTILLFTYTLTPAQTHHVVFEEIGEMAGALSYVHAVVPVNISGLTRSIYNFKEDVRNLETLYQQKRQPTRLGHDEWFHQRIMDLFTNDYRKSRREHGQGKKSRRDATLELQNPIEAGTSISWSSIKQLSVWTNTTWDWPGTTSTKST